MAAETFSDRSDMTRHDGAAALRARLLQSLLPVSSTTAFTRTVCGLAGHTKGCARHRLNDPALRGGVGCAAHPGATATGWVVFRIAPDGPLTATWHTSDPVDSSLHHHGEARASFAVAGDFRNELLNARLPKLVYARYEVWDERAGWLPIENWDHVPNTVGVGAEGAARTPDLFGCFGTETFRPMAVADAPVPFATSVAQLAESYLDRSCGTYRGEKSLGTQFGYVRCRLQREGIDLDDLRHQAFEQTAVTFSRYDYKGEFVDYLEMPHLGDLDLDLPRVVRQELKESIRPLKSQDDTDGTAPSPVTFADCFLGPRRGQILPSELDHAYLSFSIGEIATYLLHWVVLRVLASDDPRNDPFVATLARWMRAVDSSGHAQAQFHALLDCPIVLAPDDHIFMHRHAVPAQYERFLGTYSSPTRFGRVLSTVGLEPVPASAGAICSAARFLAREFPVAGAGQSGFDRLPQFRGLGWRASPLLTDAATLDAGFPLSGPAIEVVLEGIVHTVAEAIRKESLHDVSRDTNGAIQSPILARPLAQEKLREHRLRCVFPIGHVLTHWPCDVGATHYLIIPCWDAVVGGIQRPVIFAHLFVAGDQLPWNATSQDVAAFAQDASVNVLPIGALIARSYYDAQHRQFEQTARDATLLRRRAATSYKIGHPLKHRIGPLVNTLGSISQGIPSTGSENLQHDVKRAKVQANELKRLGQLLDVISTTMGDDAAEGGSDGIFKKQEWRSNKSYPIATRMSDYQSDARVRIELPPGVESLALRGWFGEGGKERPGDFLYDEVVYELLVNGSRHGRQEPNGVAVVRVDTTDELPRRYHDGPVLTFTNECDVDPGSRIKWLGDNFREWNFTASGGSTGGLSLIAQFFDVTRVGMLWARCVPTPHRTWEFTAALELRGLRSDGRAPMPQMANVARGLSRR